ncbi:MAG: subclass B1 metallo-beta-lactamase, partial [Cyclobacteriaceae bacterium]|nr:subclass B1 metallo-beta-lactamase [Cyclobacteriaceae bacterium]
LPIPSTPFTDSLLVDFNGELLECRYFGAGHTADNIIVWLPSRQILFGGCLIRSMQAKNLGNITDAKISDWDTTVSKVIKKYPNIKTVVPGHGKVGGADLLYHSVELVKEAKHNEH